MQSQPPEGEHPTRRIVRAPNHLGDVVIALPALADDPSDVVVVRGLAPLVAMAAPDRRVLPFDRGLGGWWAVTRELRRRGYREGALMTPAFSAAWMLRWGGVPTLRGTATDGRSWMLSERIDTADLRPHHRINQYRLLLGQDPWRPPEAAHVVPPAELLGRWRERLPAGPGPLVGLFPGANAPARRWPLERFGQVARALLARGARVLVLGSDGERPLTSAVSAAAAGSHDLGGRTDLSDLAAVLALCDLLVTNDTGPMHLAGAVGTPTVTLWGPSDPEEVRQVGAPDVRVTGAPLPCKPCYRNECRRRGRGTILADAHEECMRLIEVRGVLEAIEAQLAGASG
jgi:heptosyltransferase-2